MFNIQYAAVSGESRMQEVNTKSRHRLAQHLRSFQRPILGVYEQATPVTKAIRELLADMPSNQLSRYAKDFVRCQT